MTLRAILIGLLGVAFVCGVTYFNDAVMYQTAFIGNFMPISVYGLIILLIVLINPLLALLNRKLALAGSEIALILFMTLTACCIPGSGLMRYFTNLMVMPFYFERTEPAWQKPTDPAKPLYWRDTSLIAKVPSYMLVQANKTNENDVINGFIQGKGIGTKHISVRDIPWPAWCRCLLFWLPLIATFWIALLGLSLVVHRQWADHEQLPYPIAVFANALLSDKGQILSDVMRRRMFWGAMVTVMLIHLNNYACQWFPKMVPVSLTLDFTNLMEVFPWLTVARFSQVLFQPTLYFMVIAFAYLLASDVSLALGIGPLFWGIVASILAGYGISTTGVAGNNIMHFICFGAYFGMLLVLLYTGRRFYTDVLRRAFCLPTATHPHLPSVWGMRVFILAITLFVIYLSVLGRLDWQIVIVFTLCGVLTFLVMSRILAETGLFFIQPYFVPSSLLLGFFGASALGPQAFLLIGLFTVILLIDTREGFMPFITNSFKLLDLRGLPIGQGAGLAVPVILIGLAVAIPVTLFFQYDRGVNMTDRWASLNVPRIPFNETQALEQRLQSQGLLKDAAAVRGWGHFSAMMPNARMLLVFGVGVALMLLFTAARLRFTKWPLHPVMFLIWSTYPAPFVSFSFLLGWLIKTLVAKYGGHTAYRQLKPLMFGLIAGEVSAGVLMMIIGSIYFFITGHPPKQYSIMPF